MEGFSRTLSGKIAKFLFYSEPIVWVEGPTDIPFYDIILGDIPCRIEVAGGKIESRKLADALVEDELPYVVIMDGDYMILERQRSWHRRIILLHRHSSENYLFENEALLAIFRRYAGANDNFDSVSRQWTKLLEQIEDELREMLILDIAHVREATPNAAIPSSPEALFETLSWPIQFSPSRVHHYCSECKAQINEAQIALAES